MPRLTPMRVRLRHALPLAVVAWLGVGAGPVETGPVPRLYLSPSGSDKAACTRTAPCRSFDRAYRVASAGQLVEVAAGSYSGQQEISEDPSKRSERDVVFRGAKGLATAIESLDVYGKHVRFERLRIARDFYAKPGADDVTLAHSKLGVFYVRSASRISIVTSEVGPWVNGVAIIGPSEGGSAPRAVTLDRLYFHDFSSQPHNSQHMECLFVQAVTGLVVRNSRFRRCEDFDVFVKTHGSAGDPRDILIENNWFDVPAPDGFYAVSFSTPSGGATFENVLIRNNSFASTLLLKPGIRYENFRVFSNVGSALSGCGAGPLVDYNVWGRARCGANDRRAPSGFRNARAFDFHLVRDAAAVNAGHPRSYPRRDMDGHKRPRGGRPDAGADEVR
jgi:hypothetical protein